MIKTLVLFVLWGLVGHGVRAADSDPYPRVIYEFTQKKVTFLESRTPAFTVTESCLKQGQFKCLAWDAVQRAKPLESLRPDDLIGGAEPGAVLCAKHFGGTPVFGKSPSGGTRSFCLFKDQSLASSGSLLKKSTPTP